MTARCLPILDIFRYSISISLKFKVESRLKRIKTSKLVGCKAKLNCINGANTDKSNIGFCGENVVDCLSLKGFRFTNTQIPTIQRGLYTHFFLQVVTCSVANGMEIILRARVSICFGQPRYCWHRVFGFDITIVWHEIFTGV